MLPITAAVVGKGTATALTYPLENLATVYQDTGSSTKNLNIFKNYKRCFSGFSSIMASEVYLSTVFFLCYHNTSIFLKNNIL